jgi:hypothetical protein
MGKQLGSVVGEGAIVLESSDGNPQLMSADQLAVNLRGRGVQLVVLGACQTGRRDQENVWSGVVAALMRTGIPAALAMQYTIWDDSAIAFSRSFYKALAAGLQLDQAVTAGRIAVFNLCHPLQDDPRKGGYWRDWGVPVLYYRADQAFKLPAVMDPRMRERLVTEKDLTLSPAQAHGHEIEGDRRLDAAIPGRIKVEHPTEVWAQVCLPDSSGFRDELPQYTDAGDEIVGGDVRDSRFPVAFPVDPVSGRPLPTQVRVEVHAPDFLPERLRQDIRLSPEADSGLLTFNLTPRVVRSRSIVHVTVLQEPREGETLTLGSTALSTEVLPAGAQLIAQAIWKLVSLPLMSVVTRSGFAVPASPSDLIPSGSINKRLLYADDGHTVEEVARALAHLPQNERMGWYVLVRGEEGGYSVLDILNFDRHLANQEDDLWGLQLREVPGLLSRCLLVDRQNQSRQEAEALLAESEDHRILVLEDGNPMGLIVDRRRGGAGLPGTFRKRLFRDSTLREGLRADIKVLCPEDGEFYLLRDLVDPEVEGLRCPRGHQIAG